jgi:hypothetical protein
MRNVALLLAALFACATPVLAEPPAPDVSEVLARQAAVRARFMTDDPPSEREVRAVETDLIELLRQAPDDPKVTDSLGQLYQDWQQVFPAPSPALQDLVEHARDPARLARRLQGPGRRGTAIVRIVLAALAARPADPALWKMAADSSYARIWKAAFLAETFRRLGGDVSDTAVAVAGEWLGVELREGLVAEALADLRSLPPAVRERILAGPLPKGLGDFSSPAWEAPRDLRLDLAIAFALTGDRERAVALEGTLPRVTEPGGGWLTPPPAPGPAEPLRDAEGSVRRLLDRLLRPSPEDSFERLTTALAHGNLWGDNLVWYLLLERLARREGYPAVAAYADQQAFSQTFGTKAGDLLEEVHGLPPGVRATLRRLAASRESLVRGLQNEVPAASRFGVARIRFEERTLPAPTVVPKEAAGPVEGVDWSGPSKLVSLVRKELDGERAVAVGVSQDYEAGRPEESSASSGGYWVYLSDDRGRTWSAPLYTGLRAGSPYQVRSASAIPMLTGDRLQLEVTTREPDPDRLTPPPLYFGPGKIVERGKVIEISLADLRRDSDGDGLSDIAEQRLLTDPEDPDTDDDGLLDATDPMPGVPFVESAEAASRAAAIASIFEEIAGWDPQAHKLGESPIRRETEVLIADPTLFTGFRPVRRTIVITEADRDGFGLKPSAFLRIFFDHSGRRAFVIWAGNYKGGQFRLEESGGVWKRGMIGNWIA